MMYTTLNNYYKIVKSELIVTNEKCTKMLIRNVFYEESLRCLILSVAFEMVKNAMDDKIQFSYILKNPCERRILSDL